MDPRDVWLSENFRLSDFLGNHSVYSRGVKNHVAALSELQESNAKALCAHALEPMLTLTGPLSIAYGLISPEFSKATVMYQDPDKPSHHRWDLGAAADVVSHYWTQGLLSHPWMQKLDANENTVNSPAMLAHRLDADEVPYSRLISYSESPYLCIAVSAREVEAKQPRRAFYENRYNGKPKAKPEYIQLSSANARAKALRYLQEVGLDHPWEGGGFPSYHGGGRRQYQHMRVSKYTMVSDWLFNLKSISEGVKNIPALLDEKVQDAFAAAGMTYDYLLDSLDLNRLSILQGYVCRAHPDFSKHTDWRQPSIAIELGGSRSDDPRTVARKIRDALPPAGYTVTDSRRGAYIELRPDTVLDGGIPIITT